MNVRINLGQLKHEKFRSALLKKVQHITAIPTRGSQKSIKLWKAN